MTYLQAAIECYKKVNKHSPSQALVNKWIARLKGFANIEQTTKYKSAGNYARIKAYKHQNN